MSEKIFSIDDAREMLDKVRSDEQAKHVTSLRDQFAMAALASILQNSDFLAQLNKVAGVAVEPSHMALAAYNIADAMMEERK